MKLYSSNESYKLYQGDMLDMLEAIEPNSIDSVITDPPYELNFMSKGWDNAGVSFQPDTWRRCYEVLKPGGYLLAFGGSRTFHRIACAIEDAGFEIRDTIMWLYGCYSADTQVLTNQGWKYFYELDKTEKILQWNKDTNELTWLQPLNYFEYDIKDELIHYKNRHTDQLITKNHNVVCKVCKRRKQKEGFDFYKAEDIKKSWIIDFPLAGELKDGLHNDNAYIIGWWLTDAWKHKDGKACMFSQSKPKTLEKLRNYFNANNINYSEYTKKVKNIMHHQEHSFYVTGDLAKYLLTNYNDREMTWDFLTWDYDSRLKLIEGLIDGDGSDRKGQYSNVFWSKKKDRLDIFQALCISLNMRSHIDYNKGCVYFNEKHNTTQIQTRHHQPLEKYEGKVYCLETETGAFVVRRNGKAFISGNSGFPKSMNIGLAIDKKNGIESIDTGIKIPKATNEWQGWGTALKPSFEPIIIARKPFKGSLVDNVIKNGVGGINIDECRVGTGTGNAKPKYEPNNKNNVYGKGLGGGDYENTNGRFPANTILTYDETDFDEVCGGFPDTKISKGGNAGVLKNNIYGKYKSVKNNEGCGYNDSGSASRYFMNCKYTGKDEEIWKQLLVNNVGSNLEILKATKDNIAQMNVEDLLKELKDHYAKYVDNQLDLTETPIVQDIVEILTWDFKIGTSQVIQDFILNYKECTQFLNLVQFVEKMDNIDTTQTTQSLLKLFGYVKNAITNYIVGNFTVNELDQKRYTYQPKASKKDRDEGLDDFNQEKVNDGRNTPIDNAFQRGETLRKNTHPTVKPTELMQYLVRLVTPNGGTILDPFNGSGSTGKAVMYENKERNKNYKYIGIELTEEYLPISKARIEYVYNLAEEEKRGE